MEKKALKVFLGMIAHETNTFSPIPTSKRSFEEGILYRSGARLEGHPVERFPAFGDVLDIARQRGDRLHVGLSTWTQPSGIVGRRAYESLRDELLADLRACDRPDAVILVLHGAMVAEGYSDCEGDLLLRVREIVGPGVPVGALLDLHGNISDAMIVSGAFLIACKEYPHIDYPQRARELYDLVAAVAGGAAAPEACYCRVPMVGLFGTTEEPMKRFVHALGQLEGQNGIVSISAMHGFPWSDTPHTGAAIVVLHDGTDQAAAVQLARKLGDEFFGLRKRACVTQHSVADALDQFERFDTSTGPVVLADGADNPGGGAACDSTFVLRAMLERKVCNAAVGMIWDPQAAQLAADAGVGATLPLRLGGKTSPFSGSPLDVTAQVLAVRDDATQRGLGGAGQDPLGLTVAVRVEGIDIVINSIRQQVFSTDCFENLGISLADKRLVAVKSSQHFRASFDPISSGTLYCTTPGSLNADLSTLPYRQVRRPLWPLDDR